MNKDVWTTGMLNGRHFQMAMLLLLLLWLSVYEFSFFWNMEKIHFENMMSFAVWRKIWKNQNQNTNTITPINNTYEEFHPYLDAHEVLKVDFVTIEFIFANIWKTYLQFIIIIEYIFEGKSVIALLSLPFTARSAVRFACTNRGLLIITIADG